MGLKSLPTSGRVNLWVLLAFVVTILIAGAGTVIFQQRKQAEQLAGLIDDAVHQRDLLNNPSEAMVILNRAAKIDPDHWQVQYEKGRTAYALNQISNAVTALEASLIAAPKASKAEIQMQLGQAYRTRHKGSGDRRDFQMAIGSFDQAMRDPNFEVEALYHTGMLRLFNKDFELAVDSLEKLLEKSPNYEHKDQVESALMVARQASQ